MKICPPSYLPIALLVCLIGVFSAPARAAGEDWKPIDPTQLALKNSTVEKARDYYAEKKSLIKPNDEVKKMAATLVADAKSDDEKLERCVETGCDQSIGVVR